jgi:DNA-binding NtrC family response regulator
LLPDDWLKLTYREAIKFYNQAFDRVYLPNILEQKHGNITQAAKAADLDRKTFREKWKNAGLRSITGELEPPEEREGAADGAS